MTYCERSLHNISTFLLYYSDMSAVDKVDVGNVQVARDYVRQFL